MTGLELLAQSAAENLTGADLLYWPCGQCFATPGVPCRTATGRLAKAQHVDREASAGRWERWGRGAK